MLISSLQWPPPKQWQAWENLLLALFRAEWGDSTTQKNGRNGQRQHGVDIFGRPCGLGGWAGIQGKTKDSVIRETLSVKELRDEISKARKFRPRLQQFVIATTARRDVRIQEEARKITERHRRLRLFSVHVYAWDDIVELLDDHPSVFERHYEQTPSAQSPQVHSQPTKNAIDGAPLVAKKDRKTDAPLPNALILPIAATRVLGLIATCPWPMPASAYQLLLPVISWKAEVRRLSKLGVIDASGPGIVVHPAAVRRLLPSVAAKEPFIAEWLKVLEPLQAHPDTAAMLSMLHSERGDIKAAANVILDVAEEVESGFWGNLLSTRLTSLAAAGADQRLEGTKRLQFIRLVALRALKGPTPRDTFRWIDRLKRESRKQKKTSWVARAMLLTGLTFAKLADHDRAVASYRETIEFAKRHRLHFLAGHALHNLAMALIHSDPDAAELALKESEQQKLKAGDIEGLVASLLGQGNVIAIKGMPKKAQRIFVQAERVAAMYSLRDVQTFALVNIATSLVDQGRPRESLPYFKAAESIAKEDGFKEGMVKAVGGHANALCQLKRFGAASNDFLRLAELERENGSRLGAVIALQSAGACLLSRKKGAKGRAILKRALAAAVDCQNDEWIVRCEKDIAASFLDEGRPTRTITLLREAASRQRSAHRLTVAARLFEFLASVLREQNADSAAIAEALQEALRIFQRAPDSLDQQLRLLRALFVHFWERLDVQNSFDVLAKLRLIASRHGRTADLVGAIDQHGSCLQRLGRPGDAIPFHRMALSKARKKRELDLVEQSLNNLGEAFRKSGKLSDAIDCFLDAEKLARNRGDDLAEIQTAHNRALALADQKRFADALEVVRRCRNRARQGGHFAEYVSNLHALADFAWRTNKPRKAERLYRDALRIARKHELLDEIGGISWNLANCFRVRNESARALAFLQAGKEAYSGESDYHEFLGYMGDTAIEIGEWKIAEECWTEALGRARLAQAPSYVADSLHALAEIANHNGDAATAQDFIAAALRSDLSSVQRAALLTTQMQFACAAGNSRRASHILNKLDEWTHEHKLAEHRMDAHMAFADWCWSAGRRVPALQSYVAALAAAVESDAKLNLMVESGIHVVDRLGGLPESTREKEIVHLHLQLTKWLSKQAAPCGVGESVARLLWPFRVALRFESLRREGRFRRHVDGHKILAEEILRDE